MERIKDAIFLIIGLSALAVWFLYEDGAKEQERQLADYCEMVALYQKTNGESGWPNYEGIDCDKDTL